MGYHNLKTLSGEEWVGNVQDPLEREIRRNYELGQIVAMEALAEENRQKAGTCFSVGHDDRALYIREVAQVLDEKAAERRALYDEVFHPERKKS